MKTWMPALLALFSTMATAGQLPAPVAALQKQGLQIRGTLPAPEGYRGYVAEYGGRSMPLYLLPDGRHVVIGNLFDADGNDLTSGPLRQAIKPKLDASTWKALADSTWIAEGARNPERIVYVFSDTECPYCHQLWQETQPLLADSHVQVRYVLVAVIRPESLGRAAAILADPNPSVQLRRHEDDYGHSPMTPMSQVPTGLKARLAANAALMNRLGATGTPAIVYRDAAGKLQLVAGLPSDPAQLKTIFGR